MSGKLTFENVYETIALSGDQLLSKKYVNNYSLLDIKCGSCGTIYPQTIKRYKEGKRHMPCNKRGRKPGGTRPITYIEKICPGCDQYFKVPKARKDRLTCSQKCLSLYFSKKAELGYFSIIGSKGGKISASIQVRRSKNEMYFAELCEKTFKIVLTNEPIFNGWDADIILPELKIAVLWNGIWHYKQVRADHNLSEVQRRDALKLKIIRKHGYIPYIVKDMGKENRTFVRLEFEYFKEFLVSSKIFVSN